MFLLRLFGFLCIVSVARGGDSACLDRQGTCQEDNLACAGGYESGLCSGSATRRCCLPSSGDSACINRQGTCQEDNLACAGSYESGLCSGSATRRCCLPSSGDSACLDRQGTCQEDNLACAGGYESGLCSGSATRRCCLPSSSDACSKVNIITRSQWGARAASAVTNINIPVDMFFIHHTDTPECNDVTACSLRVRNIQNYHMDTKGWSDIGYSFLVGGDGNVYEGRGWSYVGAHTQGYNSKSFAASMIGDFASVLPNSNALSAVKNLIACGVQLGKISAGYRLYGHRDAGSTSCPGDRLYTEIQTWPSYSYTQL